MVPMNKIHRRCCRDCRPDRKFSISATLVAAVAPVGTREFKIYDVTVTKTFYFVTNQGNNNIK